MSSEQKYKPLYGADMAGDEGQMAVASEVLVNAVRDELVDAENSTNAIVTKFHGHVTLVEGDNPPANPTAAEKTFINKVWRKCARKFLTGAEYNRWQQLPHDADEKNAIETLQRIYRRWHSTDNNAKADRMNQLLGGPNGDDYNNKNVFNPHDISGSFMQIGTIARANGDLSPDDQAIISLENWYAEMGEKFDQQLNIIFQNIKNNGNVPEWDEKIKLLDTETKRYFKDKPASAELIKANLAAGGNGAGKRKRPMKKSKQSQNTNNEEKSYTAAEWIQFLNTNATPSSSSGSGWHDGGYDGEYYESGYYGAPYGKGSYGGSYNNSYTPKYSKGGKGKKNTYDKGGKGKGKNDKGKGKGFSKGKDKGKGKGSSKGKGKSYYYNDDKSWW